MDQANAGGSASLGAVLERLAENTSFILLAGGLVFLAYLVNRFFPQKRSRIRRIVFLYLLYLLFAVAHAVAHVSGLQRWADGLGLAEDLFAAFTIINLAGVGLFDVVLSTVRVEIIPLWTDIFVGVAYVAVFAHALVSRGLNPSSVIGGAAVASAVLALSLQSTLGNILGGVALQLDGSIQVGDWIQLADNTQGLVREIRWRHTKVETRNWDTIVVPNSSLLAQNIIILGKRQGQPVQHRMWVYFNVDFRYSPTMVINAVREALLSAPIENVAEDPPPGVICYDFAKDGRDSFAYYAVRYWLTDLRVDDPTNSAVRARIYSALKRACIPLARPVSTLFISPNDDDDQSRVERQRARRKAALEHLSLFRTLTEDEKSFVAEHMRYAPFTAGETMTHQGAVAHWLYVVTAGTAEVRVAVDGAPAKKIATIDAPGFFGEMGLMTGEPRANDVVAITDVECYRIDKEAFQKLIQERPEIAREMSEKLAERRVELLAAREGLDAEAKRKRLSTEQERIFERIQGFFGLKA